MIKYNTLKIEGNSLIVDFEVEDKPYYSDTKILGVRIDTSLTYGKELPYDNYDIEASTEYSVEIPLPSGSNELFIITPKTNKIVSPDSPCGADVVDIAVVYDRNILLDKGLGYLKELGDTCEVSRSFVDFILKRYALDMAIATCNYSTAIKYWNMLTMARGTTIKGCGCHGK